MGLFDAMDISASGLTAQRLRLDVIANNVANINTTRTGETTPAGNPVPYRRQTVVFTPRPAENFGSILNKSLKNNTAPGRGVQVQAIVEDQSEFKLRYDPDHPDAAQVDEEGIPKGYVRLPNVNIVTEMIDSISATRAYEANVTVLNASKAMFTKALEIGRG